MQCRIQGEGSRGWNPPFFWMINAFEWGHIVVLGWKPPFLEWLGPPLICHQVVIGEELTLIICILLDMFSTILIA